ncbi:MFS transporter [Rubritalea tangerina]|uniref:MFS transporter n=1 Tax=Rubritalea tangerina TaxID=430798 RepID=A0ABW4Z765_9BACT
MDKTLTNKERSIIFWASFLALMAAGVGFGIRVMSIGIWEKEFNISGAEAGGLFGQSLWPIAVGMILFSLIVDKIGYKISMMISAACFIASCIWTIFTRDFASAKYSFLLFGFAHGIVEAVINPLCATMYKTQKSKMLNILHASWPAGVALGAMIFILLGTGDSPSLAWREMFWFVLTPVLAFGVMFLMCHNYPEDERVEANVPYTDMLREFGGLGIFLAVTFLFYEFATQAGALSDGYDRIITSLAVGSLAGLISGFALKSAGKVLFFILCLTMIPLATAELATDAWIKKLMEPVLSTEYNLNSGWAIVFSSLIMMVLRFFAGVPLKYMSPPILLVVSAIFSTVGLFVLSGATGVTIFIAFILYGVGQTFYWPTILGFTAEQFPKGGAMTLNTVSAMGLLTLGIFGVPFLGATSDNFNANLVKETAPKVYEVRKEDQNFFGWKYEKVDMAAVKEDMKFPETEAEQTPEQKQFVVDLDNNQRKVLKVAAFFPAILGVCYLIIALFYKSRGGYKPVVLESSWE